MVISPEAKPVHHLYAWRPRTTEEGDGFPGTGITDIVSYLVDAGTLNQVLLTAEPLLQSLTLSLPTVATAWQIKSVHHLCLAIWKF